MLRDLNVDIIIVEVVSWTGRLAEAAKCSGRCTYFENNHKTTPADISKDME